MHGRLPPPRRTTPDAAAVVLLVSGTMLLAALAFQFVGGLEPCPMCHWQRWAHAAAAGLAAIALLARKRALAILPILALAAAGSLGLWHAGVEQGWWPSPVGCAAQVPPPGSAEDLIGQLMRAPVPRCDQIPWSFLGLSMAAWNALLSFAGAAAALVVWRRG